MHRYLFCPMPHSGELNPTIPVARELRARGHEVAYFINPELEPQLRQDGFQCFTGPRGVYGPYEADAANEASPFRRRFLTPLRTQLAVLARVFDDFRPDVLVDTILPFAPRLLGE